jgi:hypothetical protein
MQEKKSVFTSYKCSAGATSKHHYPYMTDNGEFNAYDITAHIPDVTGLLSSTFIILMVLLGMVHCLDKQSLQCSGD